MVAKRVGSWSGGCWLLAGEFGTAQKLSCAKHFATRELVSSCTSIWEDKNLQCAFSNSQVIIRRRQVVPTWSNCGAPVRIMLAMGCHWNQTCWCQHLHRDGTKPPWLYWVGCERCFRFQLYEPNKDRGSTSGIMILCVQSQVEALARTLPYQVFCLLCRSDSRYTSEWETSTNIRRDTRRYSSVSEPDLIRGHNQFHREDWCIWEGLILRFCCCNRKVTIFFFLVHIKTTTKSFVLVC